MPPKPTDAAGKPLYFSPAHNTWYETRYGLPVGSVDAAYRHHFGHKAKEILSELLNCRDDLETDEYGVVVYPPIEDEIDFLAPKRKFLTGEDRLKRLEQASRMPKRTGALKVRSDRTGSDVSVVDGNEGNDNHSWPERDRNDFGQTDLMYDPPASFGEHSTPANGTSSSRTGLMNDWQLESPRRTGQSAWERRGMGRSRVEKKTSPTTPRSTYNPYWRDV